MISNDKHSLERSRFSRRTARLIDALCFVAILAVIGTVIYGFTLRAIWAHGYFVAVGLAVIGALVMLIGLAQQAIAARDAATWRSMAEWQIRAARQKVSGHEFLDGTMHDHELESDSHEYYEHLVDVILESMRRANEDTQAI